MFSDDEYKHRREKIMEKLGKGLLILPSNPESTFSNDITYKYRANSNIFYFTGFTEPNCTIIIENTGDDIILHMFVQKRDPLMETWHGRRYGVSGAVTKFQADRAYVNTDFETESLSLMKKYEKIYYQIGVNTETDEIILNNMKQAFNSRDKIGLGPYILINPIPSIHELRVVKSQSEINILRKAAEISANAHTTVIRLAKPGMNEGEIEAIFDYECRKNGGQWPAYPSIVGSGVNATILHYIENSKEIKSGELVLIDAGTEYMGYASDITRTWPVNGKFTEPQKRVYSSVLRVQKECLEMAKPGVKFWDIHKHAVKIITEELISMGLLEGNIDELIKDEKYKRFFMHGIGHWLGIDTHDTGSIPREDYILREGNYFTVEPGIYIPPDDDIPEEYRGIGVRIEDDVLITDNGHLVLTSGVVKEIKDIEQLAKL